MSSRSDLLQERATLVFVLLLACSVPLSSVGRGCPRSLLSSLLILDAEGSAQPSCRSPVVELTCSF